MSTYEQARAFGGVIDILEAIGASYAIWGGMAVVAHGQPRFTQDMDVLLDPSEFETALFIKRLQETHYHVDELAVRRALSGGFFNIIHLSYHIKVDFWVAVELEHKAMIAERV